MISLLTIIPMRLLNYTTFAFEGGSKFVPSPAIAKEMIAWTLMIVIIGIVIAWIYRNEAKAHAVTD